MISSGEWTSKIFYSNSKVSLKLAIVEEYSIKKNEIGITTFTKFKIRIFPENTN